jgi:hypothetical protein
MKIRLSALLLLLVMAFTTVNAAFVNKETARTVAQNFVYERIFHHQLKWQADKVNITDVLTYSIDGNAAYYVFSNNGNGYIIVSADDQLIPVFGYSDAGVYPEIGKATNFDFLVHSFADQVKYVRENQAETPADIAEMWQRYRSGDLDYSPAATTDVEPLLLSIWDQIFPYNAMCPEDPDGPGGHALTGCVATAMSQIMYYYRFPLQGNGSKSYYMPDYGTISANFGNTYYNWNEMLNDLTNASGQSIPAVALINFHAGVSVNMNYGPDASGAYSTSVAPALKNYFRYSSAATYQEKGSMTQTQWENQFTPNLDEKKPVYMSGQGSDGGHAWVVDGYQVTGTTKTFHMNFGWGGYENGYFSIISPNGFPNSMACVKNIYPGVGYPYSCGADTLTGAQGSFEDGSGGSSNYTGNLDCTWLIAPADSVNTITLSFNLFDVHTSDSLYVYDGSDVTAPLLGVFNGTTLPEAVTSTGNRLFLRFVTDAADHAAGWQAEYHSVFPSYCSGTVTLTDPVGSFSDGSGDKNYNNNVVCKWKIVPPYAMNLTISFDSFDLLEGDDLMVYSTGGSSGSQLMGTYSGNTIPDPIVSTGTGFLIMFKSNTYNTAPGFEAQYTIGNVELDEKAGINGITIAPNPASNYTSVRFYIKDAEPFTMNIIDMAGKELYKESFSGISGNFVKNLDLSNFNKGMYFLTIHTSSGVTTRKFIVK